MVQNFMIIGVFYVNANNLHDLSIHIFHDECKKCRRVINIKMGSKPKDIPQTELHQVSCFRNY